uniref:HCO3_cotransp domain-containing protein n=1 Tax=Heterorhabditis bacteriophora TaxID=37862 RepID=A0A1I7W7W0_HETBA
MSRSRTRIRRGQYAGMSWKEKWTIFKHNRRKPGCWELFIYGLLLNIVGAGLLLLKAQLDRDVIEATIQKRFEEAGIHINGTDTDSSPLVEPNSILMVLITMFGRMANVVGTMKMYKGLGKFFSERKRKKFRQATERVQNGETEAEFTELLAECCQIF